MTDQTQQDQTQTTSQSNAAGGNSNLDPASGAQAGASAEVSRPDWLPEQFWDAEAKAPKAEDLARQYSELAAFKADADSRAAARPETADGYSLPTTTEGLDLKLPEGVTWQFDDKDPRLALGREIAHAMGLDQAGFETQLLRPFIQFEAARAHQAAEHEQAMVQTQNEALGPKADERRAAVKNWFAAQAGAESVGVIDHFLPVAGFVTAMERIMRRTSSGVAGFSGQGRESGRDPDKIEGWDAMSPAEKLHASRMRAGGARA